ncbi:Stage 0 sporulation protein J [subsurface metagenome]
MQEIQSILISKIEVGLHRQRSEGEDEEIQELAASIRRVGILVPLIVVRKDDGFSLVAGHRRIAAAALAGLTEVPAIIRESNEAEATEVSFAENFFRRDLSAVEQAAAIRGCIDNKVMTIEELAKGLHRSEQWVFEQGQMTTWPEEILQAIHLKYISVSAARNLAAISDSQYRNFLLSNAVENGVTARVTAAWLQAWQLSRGPEEALAAQPVDGPVPAAAVVPQSACMFCCNMFRCDALNYMGVCPTCLADFQEARARRKQEEKRS